MIFDRDSCIRIPKKFEGQEWCQKLIGHLTRKTKSFADQDVTETKCYYDTNGNDIMVPRYYPIEKYGHTSKSILPAGEDISINHNIKPRYVKQENAMDWMLNNNRGVLCMKPGDGKTVVSIYAICERGKKSIVFVHTDPLLKQWRDRIAEHTELIREQVGILSSATFEKDFQKPIVISTVQTYISLIKTKGPNAIQAIKDANFGIAIWDECHTSVSAEQFSKSSLDTYARTTYGLSATPERLDGNTDIIKYHLMNVHTPQGVSEIMECRVIMFHFNFGLLPKYKYRIYQLYLDDDNSNKGMFNKAVYLSLMIKSQELLKRSKQIVKQLLEKDRNGILFSERVNLIEECAKVCLPKQFGQFTGNTKEREKILAKQIIGATYQKGRDGLDVPRLDTILFLTPPANLEQAVGRIQRTEDGKSEPVVIDLVDIGCEDMKNRAAYRKNFYTKKGWTVDERYL